MDVIEYYESGNVKRREQTRDGILVKAEHYTSTGQDTIFSHPFMLMAHFPEEEKVLLQFLSDNMRYPQSAEEEGISGRVIIRFVVDTSGNIKYPKILKHLHPALDKEAMRIIKLMPKWAPGIQYGEIADTYYILPVVFKTISF
jgi:TonB family protein